MTTRADFSADDWRTITEAVALAGMIMIELERGGTVRESLAMAKAYDEAQKASGSGDLVGEVVRSAPNVQSGDFAGKDEMRTTGLRKLTEAAALIESTATRDELAAWRELVMTMTTRVAEARRGISDPERSMLGQIAAAVGAEAPAPT